VNADVLIIGGGVAGLSLAAAIAGERRIVVVEAEEAPGLHSSGRSVSHSHFGIGNFIVRALTAASRDFFQAPPAGFSEAPVATRSGALFFATGPMLGTMTELEAVMTRFAANLTGVDAAGLRRLVPILRTGAGGALGGLHDPDALKLDSDVLLQGYARALRAGGGTLASRFRVAGIERSSGGWRVRSEDGRSVAAPLLVNAAGAWADEVARSAGVPRLGLNPLRRTAIIVDPPEGADVHHWPFTKTVTDDFYMLPEGGKIAASPVDEAPSDPCDARPEELDIAMAAAKVEEYTTLTVRRIAHSWAGLRTFAPDRTPVIGTDPSARDFFWLAGQGGFGLQTAPALASAAASLILQREWPQALAAQGVHAHDLAPERLIHGS